MLSTTSVRAISSNRGEDLNRKIQIDQTISSVRLCYKAHFLLCFIILCMGIMKGSGKKYIPIQLSSTNTLGIGSNIYCHKAYANVLSVMQDSNAIICCQKNDDPPSSVMSILSLSYEDILCSRKVRNTLYLTLNIFECGV